jgi:hypothetical protein
VHGLREHLSGDATRRPGPWSSRIARRPRSGCSRPRTGRPTAFRNLTSLQKWIIERKVTREDRISRTGHAWRRLGEIVELEPFFDVVDEADKARAAALSARGSALKNEAQAARRSSPGRNPSQSDELRPAPLSSENAPLDEMDPERSEMQTAVVTLGGGNVLKVLLGLAVAALVAYVGITQFWKRPAVTVTAPPPAAKRPPPVVVPEPTPVPPTAAHAPRPWPPRHPRRRPRPLSWLPPSPRRRRCRSRS